MARCLPKRLRERYYDENRPVIVVALNDDEDHRDALRTIIYSRYLPHKGVIWRYPQDRELFRFLPFLEQQKPLDGKTTVYLCRHGACEKPLTDIADVEKALDDL